MRRALLLLVPLALAAQWTPELTFKVKTISSTTPSPDGKHVIWVETRAIMEADKSETRGQIMLGRADGSGRFALTSADRHATQPAWSPDGKFVYFLSKQVHRIPVDGGEAEALTDWKGTIGGFAVSPDGKSVAIRAVEERAEDEKAKKEKRDWTVIDDNPPNSGIWMIAADGDGPRKPKKLVAADREVLEMTWSPDSKRIAYSHQKRAGADYWPTADVSEVEVESGQIKALAATNAAEQSPRYSPDGKYVAFERSSDPPRWAFDTRITILGRADGKTRELVKSFDENPNIIGWSSDSMRVLFSETKGTRPGIYQMPIDGPPSLVYDRAFSGTLNAGGTHLAVSSETPIEPPEAYVVALAGGKPVRVSAANTSLPKFAMGETRVVQWKAKDGKTVEATLILPVNYDKAKRVPLLLNIHGGPAGVWMETFAGRASPYPAAVFAERGYAILRPNPRGSSGYGKDFRFANMNDWGGGDYQDLMAGVDEMIKQGIADPERLGVMGWSYGGFMTSWVVTQTKRFKAAAVGAGVTNLWSFTGTADIPGFLPDYFGGEPWDNLETYKKHSAMFQIKGVSTPTLVVHGENDIRVPITQGQEFYRALKRQGVTTKMVTYPRQGHGVTEPKLLLDVMNRHLDWMDKYVR